jgi:large conductance mechanosensitive channel
MFTGCGQGPIRDHGEKEMLKEFRDFAMRGSVVDLAIGVIIGAAFGKIVSSLVEDIIMPIITWFGSADFSNYYIGNSKVTAVGSLAEAKKQGAVLAYGNFVTVAVNFLIIAVVLFLVVRALNKMKRQEAAAPPPAPPKSEVLLEQIRDALVKR